MHISKLVLASAALASASADAQFDNMMNPMGMMMPMTMMMAPMGMGMMNPSMMMNPIGMMAPMGGFGGPSPQQKLGNPYLNPMGAANPYLMPQQPQGFFPMATAAPAPAYGASPYSYFAPTTAAQPVMPQAAPAATPWDPTAWMQMFAAPTPPTATTPKK
jgi:hypothetical protein